MERESQIRDIEDTVPPTAEPGSTPAPEPQAVYDSVVAALRTVFDPEIPVNIYDLGLIYRIDIVDRRKVEIDMTLTAPGCPVAGEMLKMVREAVEGVDAVASVTVNLVFDPPWDKIMMSDEAKVELGFIGFD